MVVVLAIRGYPQRGEEEGFRHSLRPRWRRDRGQIRHAARRGGDLPRRGQAPALRRAGAAFEVRLCVCPSHPTSTYKKRLVASCQTPLMQDPVIIVSALCEWMPRSSNDLILGVVFELPYSIDRVKNRLSCRRDLVEKSRSSEIYVVPVKFECDDEMRAKVERHVKGMAYK